MKHIVYILFLVSGLITSCRNNENPKEIPNETSKRADSILIKSQISIHRSDSIIKKSDKAISKKVKETFFEITGLRQEVKETKNALDQAVNNPKIIKIVDTVYVETKKNFWGKEKKSVKVTSDSTVIEDSTNYN